VFALTRPLNHHPFELRCSLVRSALRPDAVVCAAKQGMPRPKSSEVKIHMIKPGTGSQAAGVSRR